MNITASPMVHNCTSCQLCATVCPKSAIEIRLDEEGFYRPVLNEEKCVDCSICSKVCYKYDRAVDMTTPEALSNKTLYAARIKDKKLLAEVTSGGVSDLLAHELLNQGYEVVGVVYDDEKGRAVHKVATTPEGLLPFRGSKYIQSFSFEAFRDVLSNCRNKKYAVFGTPCQIYALAKLAELRKVREHFFFVDLYCHGCPSMHIWTKYRQHIIDKTNYERFDKVVFRSKVRGWGNFYVVVVVDGRVVFKSSPADDAFYELFFSDQVLNGVCHECQLRSTLEYTDIRLGDFWGKKFIHDHTGVSAVSVCSDRGHEMFRHIKDKLEHQVCDYADFLPFQSYGKSYHPSESIRRAVMESLKNPKTDIKHAVDTYKKQIGAQGRIRRCAKKALAYCPRFITDSLKAIAYAQLIQQSEHP